MSQPSDPSKLDDLLVDTLAGADPPDDEYSAATARAVERYKDRIELGHAREPDAAYDSGSTRRSFPGRIAAVTAFGLMACVAVGFGAYLVIRDPVEVLVPQAGVDFGEATRAMVEYREPIAVVAARTNPALAGGVMASGEVFDPDQVIGASDTFPVGVVLEVESGDRSRVVRVPIRDVAGSTLVLSSGALVQLGLPRGSDRIRVWVRAIDYEFKKPAESALDSRALSEDS